MKGACGGEKYPQRNDDGTWLGSILKKKGLVHLVVCCVVGVPMASSFEILRDGFFQTKKKESKFNFKNI